MFSLEGVLRCGVVFFPTVVLTLLQCGLNEGHLFCNKDRWVYSVRAEDQMAISGYQVGDILRSPDTLASCSTKCQVKKLSSYPPPPPHHPPTFLELQTYAVINGFARLNVKLKNALHDLNNPYVNLTSYVTNPPPLNPPLIT